MLPPPVETKDGEPAPKAKAKGKGKAKGKAKAKAGDVGVVGQLTCKYEGVAEARTVDSKQQKKEAVAVATKVTMELVYKGLTLTVNHNLNKEDRAFPSSASFGQSYGIEGMFRVKYEQGSAFGKDNIHITVQPAADDPMVASSLAFVIAYWMHPKRMEEIAARKCKRILAERVPTLFSIGGLGTLGRLGR